MASIPKSELAASIKRYRKLGRNHLVRFRIFQDKETGKIHKAVLDKGWEARQVDPLRIDSHAHRGLPVGCRLPPNIAVLDLDPRNGAKGSFLELKLAHPNVTHWFGNTERVDTGGGGVHYYGIIPRHTKLRAHLPGYRGIDIKGPGSLVVIPGSPYPGGNVYRSIRADKPLPIPVELLELMRRPDHDPDQDGRGDMELEDVEELVSRIDNEDVEYADWFRVLAAIHYEVGEEGREIALDWSSASDKHDQGKFDLTWESLGRYTDKQSTGATLVMLAQRGWPEGRVDPLDDFESEEQSEGPSKTSDDAQTEEENENGLVSESLNDATTSIGEWFQPLADARNVKLRYVIKHFLYLESLAVLIGEPGSMKSFLAIAWSVHVAAGLNWGEHRVEQGTVIYMAGEGQANLRRRFEAYCAEVNVKLDDLPILVLNHDVVATLSDKKTVRAMVREIPSMVEEYGWPEVNLVVVDTFARLTALDENSAQDMATFFNHVGRFQKLLGACVLTLHHPGHQAKERARGSSAWMGATDTEFLLSRLPGSMDALLRTTKIKDGRENPELGLKAHEFFFGLDKDGDEITTLAIVPDPQVVREQKEVEKDQDVLVMREIIKAPGLSIGKVAELTGIDRNRAAYVIKSLKKRGYLDDRDRGPAKATRAGIDWYDRVNPEKNEL